MRRLKEKRHKIINMVRFMINHMIIFTRVGSLTLLLRKSAGCHEYKGINNGRNVLKMATRRNI